MINIAFFTNKKILFKQGNAFWQFDVCNLDEIKALVDFVFSNVIEIFPNYYVAHIDSGNIDSLAKYRSSTQFTSLKEIVSQDATITLLIDCVKSYYSNAKFEFGFIEKDSVGNKINTQIFGFCINTNGECCIVRDEGEHQWTLPGGGCEFGENVIDGFIREVKEEAQMSIKNIEILGYIHVRVIKNETVIEEIVQARLAAKTEKMDIFIPLKDGFETAERAFVPIEELHTKIDWLSFDSGKVVFEKFKVYFKMISNNIESAYGNII